MAKISILLPDLRGGGVERIRIVLAREFALMGHEVEFVLMQERGELLDEAKDLFSVVGLGIVRVRSLFWSLVKYLRRSRPDAILVGMWPLTVVAPIAVFFARRRCKVVVSEHGMLSAQYSNRGALHSFFLRWSTFLGYRLAKGRVGVSRGLAMDMASLSKLKESAFHVIHNPLPPRDEPKIDEVNFTEAMWGVPKGARVLTVGNLKAVKNHRLLLNAFAKLCIPTARLMLVGEGSERGALSALAQELGMSDRVIFAGYINDPTPFYCSADLFVLSSDYEGFGNVLIEAMASGLSIVSTDCPSGPREILKGGKYGRLVPVGDLDAMAKSIAASLDARESGENLRVRASEFKPNNAAEAYLRLLGLLPARGSI